MSFPTRGESMSLDESHETSVVVPSHEAIGTSPDTVSGNADVRVPAESKTALPAGSTPHSDPEALPDDDPDEVLGTTARDRTVLLVLVAICLTLMTWHWAKLSSWGRVPIEIDRQQPIFHEHRLDPNTATWVELMQLEGIGEVLARRIVEDRETRGRFESIDELQRVSGIGAKTVEKLRPWLEIRSADRAP